MVSLFRLLSFSRLRTLVQFEILSSNSFNVFYHLLQCVQPGMIQLLLDSLIFYVMNARNSPFYKFQKITLYYNYFRADQDDA